jgi:hypothetical protein
MRRVAPGILTPMIQADRGSGIMPTTKVRKVAAMLNAIHAREGQVVEKLRITLARAAELGTGLCRDAHQLPISRETLAAHPNEQSASAPHARRTAQPWPGSITWAAPLVDQV